LVEAGLALGEGELDGVGVLLPFASEDSDTA
jgi:hypothetical protein